MRPLLLFAAVTALLVSLWAGWSHFQGTLSRDRFLAVFDLGLLAWFVLATSWAYTKPRN